jgi:hypothetical protein
MWLLIDDIRDLNVEAIARTPAAARKLLAAGGWECVCFDHDLGEASSESGYDVLKWGLEQNFLPAKVQLVTSNPVGRENMTQALLQAGYSSKDGINFVQTG